MSKTGKKLIIFAAMLLISVAAEFLLFNYRSVTSIGREWTDLGTPNVTDKLDANGNRTAINIEYEQLFVDISDCHLDLRVRDAAGEDLPVDVTVNATDDSHSAYYLIGSINYTAQHTKGSYFRIHTYGKVGAIRFTVSAASDVDVEIVRAEINGHVPLFFSFKRVVLIFIVLALLYLMRPSSSIHDNRLWNVNRHLKTVCAILLVIINIAAVLLISLFNDPFVVTPDESHWSQHNQYAQLARSLKEGKLDIEYEFSPNIAIETLDSMKNPYDLYERGRAFADKKIPSPWDIAYYNGKFYVYFGVLPVVAMYLPYHLLTGGDLPNIAAFLASYALLVIGAFLFTRVLIKYKFPRTPFSVYLILSLMVANCTGAFIYAFAPRFYCTPIVLACALVLLGLTLWFSAAETICHANRIVSDGEAFVSGRSPRFAVPKLIFGSLFIALTAATRPQFLIFSVLAVPIFLPLLFKNDKASVKIARICSFAVPFAAVAALVMAYNSARFGSPFDFGANYNLTTNDMRLRGFNAARLPDGLFAYLFQLPNLSIAFPYVNAVSDSSVYLGLTVREIMTGGALFTNVFLWSGVMIRSAFTDLKKKRLAVFSVMCAAAALIVIIADTEMAGILSRYNGDFLLLLYIPAIAVFLQKLETADEVKKKRYLAFLVAAFALTFTFNVFSAITTSEIWRHSPDSYAALKDFFKVF